MREMELGPVQRGTLEGKNTKEEFTWFEGDETGSIGASSLWENHYLCRGKIPFGHLWSPRRSIFPSFPLNPQLPDIISIFTADAPPPVYLRPFSSRVSSASDLLHSLLSGILV